MTDDFNSDATIADIIAAQFGNDGCSWEDADGCSLESCVEVEGGIYHDLVNGGRLVTFPDGSHMALLDAGWDVVFFEEADSQYYSVWDGSICYGPTA